MIKYFIKEESPYHPGKYIVAVNHDNFYCSNTSGSFCLIGARLFGISYAQFLRMCRDVYGAEIFGKNSKYPVAYFKLSEGLDVLLKELNTRAALVVWEREHPDFEEHKEYVK